MRSCSHSFAGAAGLLLTVLTPFATADSPTDRAGVEFFEKKIRPALIEHCARCHSAEAARNKKLKGGLLVDTRDGLLKGGDSGPALVPGKPDKSLLLQAMTYEGDLKMPPKGKLPEALIADFTRWIALGAPDPRGATATTSRPTAIDLEAGRRFWAYQLPQRAARPVVKTPDWPMQELDFFILSRLEREGLTPAPEADRATLARRLFHDLTGLPPTPEQVDAFLQDRDPSAYEKLVDRLLDSSHFGERWGRHWLDVARFGESLTLRGFILKEAWRYRDYVIEAFNRDMPFDQFVREQLAGDLLPATSAADRRRQLTATTFLALGNTNLEEQDKKQLRMDFVDEQLDVISKGFLGQTVTCARCHDHKFDPIPTKDYYALAGILRNSRSMEHANVSKWIEVPLPVDPAQEAMLVRHEKAVAALQEQIAALKKTNKPSAKAVLAVTEVPGIVVDDSQAKKVGTWQVSQHSGSYIGAGYLHDQNAGKGEKTLTFQPETVPAGRYEVRLAYSPGTNRSEAVPVTVFSADGEKTVMVDMKKSPSIESRFISLGEYRFEKNGLAYVIISNEETTGHVTADAVIFLPLERTESGAAITKETKALSSLEADLKRLKDSGPVRAMVMTVVEEKQIEETRVHVRGIVHSLGEAAPRGVLRVATVGDAPRFPANQSGRRELADWIASPDNPLTARVIVNRVWHWLFGSGLVRTTDNFGTTGERPSHPELLDALTRTFVDEGWSIKKLVRHLVLSRTYRQSSAEVAPLSRERDPENRLFGRANRRRLEAESLRDTFLAVSGRLSLEKGGPTYPATLAADYGYRANDTRRSVYLPVFRNALPEIFEIFDFADPSMVTGRRNVSTVALQALFLMNHPFVLEQSRAAAERLLKENLPDGKERLERAYRRTLGRLPTEGERQVAMRFLDARAPQGTDAWAALFQALFASADFRYVN